jgi:hypothetical protein
MAMTKRIFRALAEEIKALRDHPDVTERARRRFARTIADVCAGENPNFDRGRFYHAADVDLSAPLPDGPAGEA